MLSWVRVVGVSRLWENFLRMASLYGVFGDEKGEENTICVGFLSTKEKVLFILIGMVKL